MATYSQMLKQAMTKGNIKDASDWFVDTFQELSKLDTRALIQKGEPERLTKKIVIGKMYLFHYDPKWKDVLPLYDRFPLIFPFEYAEGGFYGLNFHYIPYIQRARLLDSLMGLANNKTFTDSMRLNLSYRLLKSVAKSKLYEPCVKRYLNSHVRSRFLLVSPQEWTKALVLPLEDFVYKKR